MYNQNNGISQNPMCGQGLVTKLLRAKGAKQHPAPLSQNASVFEKDATTLCMSPMSKTGSSFNNNNNKKRNSKFSRGTNNMYEPMNPASMEMDTESCSSEVYSDTTSTASSSLQQVIDDIQSPVFVAQFDPQELPASTEPTVTNNNVHTADAQQQQPPKPSSSSKAKPNASWAASLPAVVEEDSQSEQSSQQHPNPSQPPGQPNTPTSRWNIPSMLTPSHENDNGSEEQEVSEYDDDLFEDPQQEKSPPEPASATTNSIVMSPEKVSPHQNRGKKLGLLRTPKGIASKKRDKVPKLSKEQIMAEARDRLIQQAMDEQLKRSEQEELRDHHYKLAILDAAAEFPGVEKNHLHSAMTTDTTESYTSSSSTSVFDPFQQHSSTKTIITAGSSSSIFRKAPPIQSFLPSAAHPTGPPRQLARVEPSMQEILLEQQATLKDMSLQNYQYRKELSECQDLFGKWRQERDKQQAIITDLVKEKEAFASEAKFLRNELSSIRSELASFQNSHQKQKHQQQTFSPEPQQQQQQQQPPDKQSKESPQDTNIVVKGERSSRSAVRLEDSDTTGPPPPPPPNQQFRSPSKLDDKPQFRSPSQSDDKHQFRSPSMSDDKPHFRSPGKLDDKHQFRSPSKSDDKPQFRSPSKLDGKQQFRSPSKSDDKLLTAVGRLKAASVNESSGENSLISGLRYSTPAKHGSAKKNPLVSGLKLSTTPKKDSSVTKPQRSVKFHDPPLNREWTLFPNDIQDNRFSFIVQPQQPQKAGHNPNNANSKAKGSVAVVGEDVNTLKPKMESRKQERSEVHEPRAAVEAQEGQGQVKFKGVAPAEGKPLTPQQQRSLFTPTKTATAASRGRTSDRDNGQGRSPNREGTSAYKHRLETIQKNRQQRVGMYGTAAASGASGHR